MKTENEKLRLIADHVREKSNLIHDLERDLEKVTKERDHERAINDGSFIPLGDKEIDNLRRRIVDLMEENKVIILFCLYVCICWCEPYYLILYSHLLIYLYSCVLLYVLLCISVGAVVVYCGGYSCVLCVNC